MPDYQWECSPAFWNLLDAACEDSLTECQAEELEGYLRSPEGSRAREIYEAYMQLNFEMYFQSRASAARRRNQALCQASGHDLNSSVPSLMTRVFESSKGYSLMAVGALALLIAVIGIVNSWGWDEGQSAQNDPAAKSLESVDVKRESRCVAHFIAAWNGVWSKDTAALTPGQELIAGQRLGLVHGIARIKLASGAELTLEGPCEILLEGERRVALQRGKLVGYAPLEAAGLVVSTPLAEVTDLGTRFGVACEDSLSEEIHVFAGVVQVALRSEHVAKTLKSKRYEAREATRLEGQPDGSVGVFPIKAAPREFHHELPIEQGSLIACYEFEGDLSDSSGNHHRGMMIGQGRIEFDPDRGNVLVCPEQASGVNIDAVTPIPAFPANCSITLAAWVKQSKRSSGLHNYVIQLGANGDKPVATLGLLPDGRIRGYLETDQSGLDQVKVTSIGVVDSASDNKSWRHVAIVYDREIDKAIFYIDGVQDSSGNIVDIYDSCAFTWYGATIGTSVNNSAAFLGKIDDARIYSRALTETEMQELVKETSRPNKL